MTTNEIFKNIKNVKLDEQVEFEQVGVYFELYDRAISFCYQNGDMNGGNRGNAIFDNPGTGDGPEEIFAVLEARDEFRHLISDYERGYNSNSDLGMLIHNFLIEFSEKFGIDKMIEDFETVNIYNREIDKMFEEDEKA